MSKLRITRDEERRIERQQAAIIEALERSNLIFENQAFAADLQAKIEQQKAIEREKRESEKAYRERCKIQQRKNMIAYLSGYLAAMIGNIYPEIYELPFRNDKPIFETISEWLVDTFTCQYPSCDEYSKQYYNLIYEKVYQHIYNEIIYLPKRRERGLKGIKKSLWEDIQNADKNAT